MSLNLIPIHHPSGRQRQCAESDFPHFAARGFVRDQPPAGAPACGPVPPPANAKPDATPSHKKPGRKPTTKNDAPQASPPF